MLWLATVIAIAGLVVDPVELQVVPETAHPAVLVVTDADGLQLLLTQLYWQLEPMCMYVCMLCMYRNKAYKGMELAMGPTLFSAPAEHSEDRSP